MFGYFYSLVKFIYNINYYKDYVYFIVSKKVCGFYLYVKLFMIF